MINSFIKYKRFRGKAPKRILIIRMQAIGDIIIMLPYIQSLREQLPADTRIDLLTKRPGEDIPEQLTVFNHVYAIGGARNSKKQLLSFLLLYPRLFFNRYDVLLDLQNHRLSRVIRFLMAIKAFAVFDRTSSNYAGDRYKNTINTLDIAQVEFRKLSAFKEESDDHLLLKFGLDRNEEYIVLNPAGAFENRNWDIKNYLEFCRLWLEQVNSNAKFVVLGVTKIKGKAEAMKEHLGDRLISLVDRTTQYEAMRILGYMKLVISEDSGLLHMSYVVGTPSVGLLGSTRSDWTNPKLPHTCFFTSDDLPCGNCMLEKCKFSEVICMTRIKPSVVLEAGLRLLKKERSAKI